MKPRTPLSRNSSSAQIEDNANGKALRPIPMLSPSTFHPLMHFDSSLPDSIIESAGSHEDNHHDGEEEDAPMSSIEQFDSPEKDNRTQGQKKILLRKERVGDRKGKGKERQRDEDTDIWDSEQVARRGQELAEAAKRKQRAKAHSEGGSSAEADSDEPGKQKKKSVDEIIARSRSRSESVASSKHPAADDEDEAEEEGVADASTTVVPSGSGPQVDDAGAEAVPRPSAPAIPHPEHDLTTLQQMEDAYVDLSGGVDETIDDDHDTNQAHIDPKDLRREEEESTQDLMEEVRAAQMQQRSMQDVDMDAGWLAGSSKAAGPPEAAPQEGDEEDEHRDDVSMVPEIHIENPSREPSTRSLSPEDDVSQPVQRMTRSRSRSKTPTVARSKASSKPKSTLRVPAVKGPTRRSAQPTTARSRSNSPNFKQPVEEIIHENPLEEERSRSETLEQELASIREQLQRLKESTKSKDAEAIERLSEIQVLLKNKQAEWASERAQLIARAESANRDKDIETAKLVTELQALWTSEKAGWETERSQLFARLESATRSKESAEKDRDFFREQYGQASGFVNAVRDENRDLEKRAKIAEEQAQSGVNLVKSTFELRIKTLEDDAKVWRKMAEFAIEKDRRTNDDVRRRAAEEPGLRARCEEQEKDIDELHHHLEVIEIELQEKEQDVSRVNAELVQWKKETTRLTGELNEALTKLDRIGRAGDEDSQGNGHEFVYRCQWRLDGNNEACPETFLTLTELEDHLFTGAHLRST
ncbi:hypothetical protein NLJ89_g9278 [Agrocybe chaxingu]|uniref:Uncharacterized protein n=1 Tax=Agrocybe chaxingu TaxID=84603 RepID=A0A9W8MRZ5_9AGAR|nr:hypothetical protein NLJ89_g9278 [Agrocybe chaxingu]